MKVNFAGLTSLLLVATAATAGDTNSKTIEGYDGPVTVTWGQPAPLPDQGRPIFDELDANNDGRLTLEETRSHRLLHSDFIYADANRNGAISKSELERWD
jgi:hypothetical protein